MIWPSFAKGIWSLIISKLGIFTDIDASQLELSGSTLKLTNVRVDQHKLKNEVVEVSDLVIGNLLLELNSSGLNITAKGVVATASLKSLTPPDLAISMLLETTKENLSTPEVETIVRNNPSTIKNSNTVTSRLADMVLSQINVRITEITLDLTLFDNKVIKVSIDELMMPNKERLEIESLTLTTSDEANIDLSQAIIWDKSSALGCSSYAETGTINRIVVDFGLNPVHCVMKIDQMRLDGLASLDLMVACLNEIVFKNAKKPTGNNDEALKDSTEPVIPLDISCSIEKIDIVDTWDSLAGPLCLKSINIDSNQVKVETMCFGDTVNVSPFIEVRFNKILEVLWEVPLSIDISLENLEDLGQVLSKAASSVSKLNPPAESEPTPITIFLPELRIGIGPCFTIQLFPHRITEFGVNLKEILIIAADGQVLVSEFYYSFADGLLVDKVKANISQGFLDQIATIRSVLNPPVTTSSEEGDEKAHITTCFHKELRKWEGVNLPAMNMNFRHISIEGVSNIKLNGEVNIQYEESRVSLLAQISAKQEKTIAELNISGQSDLKLKEILINLHIRKLCLNLTPDMFNDNTQKEHKTSDKPTALLLPRMTFNITMDEARLTTRDIVLLPHLSGTLTIAGSTDNMTANFPAVTVEIQSTKESEDPVPILKALNFCLDKKDAKTCINIASMALSCCADTFVRLTRLPNEFVTSEEPTPALKTEPEDQLDIFQDIVESEFVFTKSKFNFRQSRSEQPSKKLDIKEDYFIEAKSADTDVICQSVFDALGIITSTLSSSVDVEVKCCQWQLFDGFDFQGSRQKMLEAVERVSRAAQELSQASDSDREDDQNPAVGDFMYQSMMITTIPSKAKDLKESIAKDLGSPSNFSRSMEPKIVLSLRKLRLTSSRSVTSPNTHISVVIKDGKISDLVSTSKFKHLLSQEQKSDQCILMFTKDVIGPSYAPEVRSSLFVRPLRLSLDQDTLEFIFRFFQYSDDSDGDLNTVYRDEEGEEGNREDTAAFIQRFEFGSLPLTIDYNPRKVDFKSLRSGAAAELLNIFAIKGARLTLKSSVLHGVSGWGPLFSDLLESWLPSIRDHQLGGLISGFSPVRKALKVSKGVGKFTVTPIKRTQIPKGASVVVRKTMDELLRLRTSWLDSTEKALGG